jgi:hypothetical protein
MLVFALCPTTPSCLGRETTPAPLGATHTQTAGNAASPGVLWGGASRTDQVYWDVCDGQPSSEPTWIFLQGLLAIARQEGKHVVVVIGAHASWHKRNRLRQWIHTYNPQAKQTGDVRLLTFLLPIKSPWLNPIEPRWVHGKRKVCEPDGDLTPEESTRRLFAHFDTEPLADLVNR